MRTRVLLVDDDPMVRTGLRFLLESTEDLEVVAEAGDGVEALNALAAHTVDVVLMDVRMPKMDGIEALRRIMAAPTAPSVIMLTTWDVDDAVVSALSCGATGFLLKTAAPAEILSAIRSVRDGDAVLSPRSARRLLSKLRADEAIESRQTARRLMQSLTQRELEVAVAVGRGLSNAEIAGEMYLSPATVKTHLATIQGKLGAANRVGIAVLAERAGLLRAET